MAEMSEARMLIAELEALLAAVHADDPKREILVRVGDAIRNAKALADRFQAVVHTLKIEQAPRLAAQQEGVREVGSFGGMRFIADKRIPGDVVEFHHVDGRVDRFQRVSGHEQPPCA